MGILIILAMTVLGVLASWLIKGKRDLRLTSAGNVIGAFVGGVAGIGLAVLIAYYLHASRPSPPARPATLTVAPPPTLAERKSSVRGACWIALKESLDDPSSAEAVGLIGDWRVDEAPGNHYTVYPKIRAKNAFGATVRADLKCTARIEGPNVRILSICRD